jgi:hypothetical protein
MVSLQTLTMDIEPGSEKKEAKAQQQLKSPYCTEFFVLFFLSFRSLWIP